jgi:hypothetical protein
MTTSPLSHGQRAHLDLATRGTYLCKHGLEVLNAATVVHISWHRRKQLHLVELCNTSTSKQNHENRQETGQESPTTTVSVGVGGEPTSLGCQATLHTTDRWGPLLWVMTATEQRRQSRTGQG